MSTIPKVTSAKASPLSNPDSEKKIKDRSVQEKKVETAAKTSLPSFTSKTLPPAKETGLSQESWLKIHWKGLEEKKGRPLTDLEKAFNIPRESDPLGWSEEAWESWLD